MAKRKNWEIGFNTFWWDGLDKPKNLAKCIECLVRCGYDSVEFKVDSFGQFPNGRAIVKAAKEARKAGLKVSNLVILRNISRKETASKSIKDMKTALRICADAEIGALNCVPGGANRVPACAPDEWWEPQTRQEPSTLDILADSLFKLSRTAEALDVDIAIETVFGQAMHDLGTTLEILARCSQPRLMLTFDPSHYVLAGQDLGITIRSLGSRIRHVHLKDVSSSRLGEHGKDFIFPFPGQGVTDWKVFFDALADTPYCGPLSIEFESFRFMEIVWKHNPEPAAEISKLAVDALIAKYAS